MEILNVWFEGYVSDDVLLTLFAGRLLGRRGDECPYEQNATVSCLRDEHFTSILTNEWHSMLYQLEHFIRPVETCVSLYQRINESGSRESKYDIKRKLAQRLSHPRLSLN